MGSFEELLSQHIATSYWKQIQLTDFLGEHDWAVDLKAGTASFGSRHIYPIQIIGTESEINNTWLWAWANPGGNIPASLLKCSENLRAQGEQENIEQLREAELPLDAIDGHTLAMLSCGVCKASAYYRGPYDEGAVYFLLNDVPLPNDPVSPQQAIQTLTAVISQVPVPHRLTAISFFQQQGYTISDNGTGLEAALDGEKVHLTFDELGRICDMEATLQSPINQAQKVEPKNNEDAKGKPWWRFGR